MQSLPFKANKYSHLVSQWLTDRQAVIVSFNQLCQLRPFSTATRSDVEEALQEFCVLFVDYVSLGHFEVYEHISDVVDKNRAQHVGIPQRILQCLMSTTITALDFNDKYSQQHELDTLETDLSRLGLAFAQRLEWEDQLITSYQLAKQTKQMAKTA